MFNKAQMMIEEQKLNNSTETAILPMQCYVQPFWKHSDIEIYNESNLETMKRMPDNCIDLTVTSPPYDDLRTYENDDFLPCGEFEEIVKQLFRVTKDGGVVVWIVGDAVKNGNESGTSFYHALTFKKLGWNLFDTMIYFKNGGLNSGANNSYIQKFEYMFVFSKGKIKTANIIEDRPNEHTKPRKKKKRNQDGTFRIQDVLTKEQGKRYNVWCVNTGIPHSTEDKKAYEHPAIFPEQLANDHILSWSNEGDTIYDPFGGSGTTAKMAYLNNRKAIMSEISTKYCQLSKQRLSEHLPKGLFA